MKPLFQHGRRNDLEVKDLHNALPPDLSEPLGDALEKNWKKEQVQAAHEERHPKLFTAIRKTFMWSYVYYGFWILLCTFLR